MADNMTAGVKLINPENVISKLADRALQAKGLECSLLLELICMLRAEPDAVGDKWIPTAEQLPVEGESVLALCWHHEAWIPFVCHLSVKYKGRWITDMAGQWMMHVSHWMPLPAPPEVGK